MAFPTTSVIDNFTRSNQTPPGPLWASTYIQSGGATPLGVTSNQLYSSASSGNGYMSADSGPDQEIFCTVTTKPANGEYIGLFLRVQTPGSSAWDGYALIWVVGASSDNWYIRRYDNGSMTSLLAPSSPTLVAGEKIGMEISGSTLRVYKTVSGVWQQVGGDVTDTTYAGSGKMGIELSTSLIRVDDIGGTTAAPSVPSNTTPPVVSGTLRQRETLSCTTGSWTQAPTSYSYAWRRADLSQVISGATSSTYKLTYADVGHTIQCRVIATNATGSSTATSSNTTAAVDTPAPDTLVRVNGDWVSSARQVRTGGSWY